MMNLGDKKAWLEKHGNFAKVWFSSKSWISNGGDVVLESDKVDAIDDLFHQAKEKLFKRTNNRGGRSGKIGFGPY